MTRRIFCKVLLVVVAIFGLLVLSGVLMAQGRSEDAFDRVRKAQERHTDRLMAMDGVEGTAIGLDQSGQLAVKVFTARPGVAGIAKKLDDVPVDVVVTGKIYALAKGGKSGKPPKPKTDPLEKPPLWCERPVPIGVSTGHPDITAGTIACRVTDGTNVYALSNNHVYANENRASIGDNVLQPGTYDGGVDPDDAIGTLADFEPIEFRRWARNEIDAAIASSTAALLGNATPSDGYGTPSSETATAYVGLAVQKYGRTTGLTSGEITGINATVNVGYSRGTARFVKQIIVESETPFIGGGDSGSLLVTDNDDLNPPNPVGLLFAGTSDGLLAVANQIDLVLNRFGVTVDSEEVAPPTEPPVLTTIEVSPSSVTLNVGDTQQFTATGKDQYGDPIETGTITWASGNTAVGTISGTGLFTAAGAGSTTVSAGSGGVSGSASVTVQEAAVLTTIDVSPSNVTLNVDDTQQFTATGKDQYGEPIDTGTITWASSDTDVGIIGSTTGIFEAVGAGSTTVSATSEGVSGSASVTVQEAPAAPTAYVNIELSKQSVWRWWRVTATITITETDASGPAIADATVQGTWSETYSRTVSGTTDKDGVVGFKTGFIRESGTVIFTVNKVVKDGQEYILAGETSGSISSGSSSRGWPR